MADVAAVSREASAECSCEKHEGGRTWVRSCPEHGEAAIKAKLLPVGTRIRHVRHPELTGRIKALEWTRPGELSPIPYLIGWDDSGRASDALGWFFVYSGPESVERIEEGE
jgi:hypothetical protein